MTKWLNPYRLGNIQFFRQWAAEAWEKSGGAIKGDIWLPWKLKMVIGKLGLARHLCAALKGNRRLVVGIGGRVEYFAWPWCYFFEIVPVVWDCWPKYWPALVKFVKTNRVKTIFCTSRQTTEMVRAKCSGVKAVWLPEGIKTSLYPKGPKLVERTVDVMKFGRDATGQILYPTQEDLTAAMRNAKVVICRPRCDTHPERAQGLETLTQRYWEGMLSGCLIVGRAPQELIDLCGYNPVLPEMPEHPEDYQDLVDRNRRFAEANSDWCERIKIVRRELGVAE